MSIFHNHSFIPSEKDPRILWCPCGKMNHTHTWTYYGDIKTEGHITGKMLKCDVCGALMNHTIYD